MTYLIASIILQALTLFGVFKTHKKAKKIAESIVETTKVIK